MPVQSRRTAASDFTVHMLKRDEIRTGGFYMLREIEYEQGLPVKVQVVRIEDCPWHIHDDIQIIYVIEGEIELKLIYARYHLTKNNIHFIHSADVHGFRALTKENLVVVLSLNLDYFSRYHDDLIHQVFTTKVSENIATYKKQLTLKSHMFSIISELHFQKRGYKERAVEISHALIDTLYRDFRGFSIDPETRTFVHQISRDSMQIERISRIVGFVYSNYPYKLSLSAIAENENISSYYLSHLFQRLVGDSFRNFVSMVRVEMSEKHLLGTDDSIAQISSNMGFSNAKYYVDNFTAWFGCHPKEYRELYKNEILGRKPWRVTEMPLDSLNDAIEPYEEMPAFTGASGAVKSVSVDMKKLHPFQRAAAQEDPAKFYRDCEPQQDCIDFLAGVLENPQSRILPPVSIDAAKNKRGTFALNGMKKPLCYLRGFLENLFGTVADCSDWYLMTTCGSGIRLLFFSRDAESAHHVEFSIFNLPGRYKITEHRLAASSSCIRLWEQLEFRPNLTDAEKRHIAEMSAPRVSWHIENSPGSFTYSAELEPLDVVFAEFEKL